MYNSEKPSLEELPSSSQLLRSTFLAIVAAMTILITIILPAEYAIDLTGAGRVLGLTEMGEIKEGLAKEVEEDNKTHGGNSTQSNAFDKLVVSPARVQEVWKDEVTFTLAPGRAMEVKLVMSKDAKAHYKWSAEGGQINFDLHAHGDGEAVTYEKVRGKKVGDGSFTTPFAGEHGWFWRNRDKSDVTVKLQIRGDYSELKQKENE